MSWTTPSTWVTGNVLTASQLNTQLRDNMLAVVPSGAVLYYAASSSVPSGYSEYTAARGRMIVGLPSGGTLAGTVGTALTNVQNPTHTHTTAPTGWGTGGDGASGRLVNGAEAGGQNSSTTSVTSSTQTLSGVGVTYIQLLCITKT